MDPVIDCPNRGQLEADPDFWRLYENSFPPEERDPVPVIIRTVEQGNGLAFRMRWDGRTMGLAATHLLTSSSAAFLVYLAIASGFQGKRLGHVMFSHTAAASLDHLSAGASHPPIGVIWEVDSLSAAPDARQQEVRQRRIRFFESLGGRVLGRPYWQPPLDGGPPVPMSLMFKPREEQDQLDDATIEALVKAMYFEKYGAMNGIDQRALEECLLLAAGSGSKHGRSRQICQQP